ncbi:unnamed protein product [Ilex paraguariensis]|uniref:DUF7054 domain-containing protein n=1 Tax=Ilex paraguariensis TaxID=185542 RepID=A0ABC8TW75_9AQUA
MTSPPPLRRPHGVINQHSAAHGGRVETHELVRNRPGIIEISQRRLTQMNSSRSGIMSQRLTKLLLRVNIQNSLGSIQVVMSPENTVRDLMKSAMATHVKEKRRPLLSETDTRCSELHYSPFSLESLNPEEKLINLGSRNFFLCLKPNNAANSSCFQEVKEEAKSPIPLTYFMDFLL